MFNARLPATSNRADWIETIQVADADDGSLVDLSDYTVTVDVVPARPSSASDGYGDLPSTSAVLSGSSTTGEVTFPSSGVMQLTFRASSMRSLCPGLYDVGMTITDGTDTSQLLIGSLPVVDGIVR